MYNEEKGEKEQWLLLLGVAGMIDSKKQVEEEEFDQLQEFEGDSRSEIYILSTKDENKAGN